MTSEPQELTLEGVKAKAREWYDKGLLTAQHPERLKRVCVYRSVDGYRCAIGASLADETLKEIYQKDTVIALRERGQIKAPSVDEMHGIAIIQRRHDDWCQNVASDADLSDRTFYEQKFLKEIDHPKADDLKKI